MGAVVRGAALIAQAIRARALEASEPLVARLRLTPYRARRSTIEYSSRSWSVTNRIRSFMGAVSVQGLLASR